MRPATGIYSGAFRVVPGSDDEGFYQVIRYAGRTAPRANLVSMAESNAEEWRWASSWRRNSSDDLAPLKQQRRLNWRQWIIGDG